MGTIYTGNTTNFHLEVARGAVEGVSYINKFGRSAAATSGTDIWTVGTTYVQPTASATANVASTSAADTAAGTGARTIRILGVAGDYSLIAETLTLNGVTPVATVNQWRHVNRAFVQTAGSAETQAGDITITSNAPGTPILGRLAVGYNQTQSSLYQVPAGYTAYVTKLNVSSQSSNANGTSHIALFQKPFGGVYQVQNEWTFKEASSTAYTRDFLGFLVYPEKTIIKFRCVAASAAVHVAVNYDIFLISN